MAQTRLTSRPSPPHLHSSTPQALGRSVTSVQHPSFTSTPAQTGSVGRWSNGQPGTPGSEPYLNDKIVGMTNPALMPADTER